MDTSPSKLADASQTPATPDTLAAQLRDLERQGGGMARLAHIAAGALLVAFSAGSLLSISHAAFVQFLAAWGKGQADVPDGISLVVNLLLVLAADVALLYAASVLRVLIAAQAPKSEQRIHKWAMIGASALESSTYLYLAWQFDRPSGWFLWAIVGARALAAPLFAAYLSMARPLPVAPRDVAYQAALASGKGVVRDVATLAADASAPLRRKVKIYTASAMMTAPDRARFNDIIEAVAIEDAPAPVTAPANVTTTPEQPTGPDRPPTGGGSPTAAPADAPRQRSAQRPAVLQLPTDRPAQPRRRTAARASGATSAASKTHATTGVRTPRKTRKSGQSLEADARAAWASGARTINAMMTMSGMSRNAAGGWVRTLKAEQATASDASSAGQLAQ